MTRSTFDPRTASTPALTRRGALRGLAGGTAALLLGGCGATVPDLRDVALPDLGGLTGAAPRRIGFDLWSGVPGARFGDRIDKSVGSRRIYGPRQWRHPVTGETIPIYVRENRERDGGVRVRYLTMNADGTALARVFDRRPGQRHDRYFQGDAFVPQGSWADGTRRRYTMTQVQNGRASEFRLTLRMLRSNFTYEGRAGSMEYDWIARTPSGRMVFHEGYVYSPGVGFVDFDNRLS